jgi:hypothetical protein
VRTFSQDQDRVKFDQLSWSLDERRAFRKEGTAPVRHRGQWKESPLVGSLPIREFLPNWIRIVSRVYHCQTIYVTRWSDFGKDWTFILSIKKSIFYQ